MLCLSSCARILIEDQEWCGDIGTQGAVCYHTLSDKERVIPQPQWDHERFGQLCTHDPPEDMGKTFSQIRQWIEQLCAVSKRCRYEENKKIMRFLDRTIRATQRAQQLRQERDKSRESVDVRGN